MNTTFEAVSRETESIAADIVDAALKVHKSLGPGLLETVYEECMVYELCDNRGLAVGRQVDLPVRYSGQVLQSRLKLDLLVEQSVIVELKAVETMLPLYQAQLMTYLRLANLRLGFLINFNVPLIKHGIKRVIL